MSTSIMNTVKLMESVAKEAKKTVWKNILVYVVITNVFLSLMLITSIQKYNVFIEDAKEHAEEALKIHDEATEILRKLQNEYEQKTGVIRVNMNENDLLLLLQENTKTKDFGV